MFSNYTTSYYTGMRNCDYTVESLNMEANSDLSLTFREKSTPSFKIRLTLLFQKIKFFLPVICYFQQKSETKRVMKF